MSSRLFVGNLSFSTTAETLGKLFESIGEVLDAVIIARGQYSRGYGFVNMKDEATAKQAMDSLNHKDLDGRAINIELARAAGERSSAPRRGGFRGPRRDFDGPRRDFGGPRQDFDGPRRRFNRRRPRRFRRTFDPNAPLSKTRVFLNNLPFDTTAEELRAEFKGYGINEIIIPLGFGGRPRGYGFIEFKTPADQAKCMKEKAGMVLKEREIRLEAAREKPERAPASTTRVHLGNLPFALTEEELRAEFKGYGIKEVVIPVGFGGRPRGYGFIEFNSAADQAKCMKEKANMVLKEREIKVSAAYGKQASAQNTQE